MHIHLHPAAELFWRSGPEAQVISAAAGDCLEVLDRAPAELIGQALDEVLQISKRRAAELDDRAVEGAFAVEFVTHFRGCEPHCFRLTLTRQNGVAIASMINFSQLMVGAPPLQISALSSSLSHEIRNPLSSVKMAVQTLARNTTLSERDQRRLTIANREIRTMERMLGLLSEYGREAPLRAEPVSLRSLVEDAAALVEAELKERQIQLNIDEEPDVLSQQPKVSIDSHRLRLPLSQLLLNIAMGHPEGATLKVRLRSSGTGGWALAVEDPQSTLLPEESHSLFEPFGSRLARGAGLSLATLKRAMRAHGGDVRAEGTGASGTLFTLIFPV